MIVILTSQNHVPEPRFPKINSASGGPPGVPRRAAGVRGKSIPAPLPEDVLPEWGQGFASPVPPFAGEMKRFPDEPGARPLTQPAIGQLVALLMAGGQAQRVSPAACMT